MNDPRPRFGWCEDLDMDPQHVTEKKHNKGDTFVAVVPLPFNSSPMRRKLREAVKGLICKPR